MLEFNSNTFQKNVFRLELENDVSKSSLLSKLSNKRKSLFGRDVTKGMDSFSNMTSEASVHGSSINESLDSKSTKGPKANETILPLPNTKNNESKKINKLTNKINLNTKKNYSINYLKF